MKVKRLFAGVLAAALLASLAVLPAGAAGSSFADVSDAATAVNADILRLMGVVSGVGGNRFNPGAGLTRAEFCTMVVKFMQKGDQVALHATRTIFSDVTARHWALGYVNLAASTTLKDGEREIPLISGVGNGKFEPDAQITLAQAATILIRVLGYSSQQAGAVWPQSYLNLAASIGLTDGVSAGANDPITRAQAAQLFVNALGCKTGDGGDYYQTLGSAREDVVLLAVNVEAEDGSQEGAVRTSAGTYLPKTESVSPTALQGCRGSLVLSDKQEIVTFVPDDSTSTTITLSGAAQPTYVKGTNGRQYAIPSDTPVYTADKTEGDSYVSAHTALTAGSQITMFSQRGKVVAVYVSGSMATSDAGAVVVTGAVSTDMFRKLTGGTANFQIQKNRQTISLGDIKPYDVVTYDSLSNTLIVSDLRLTCVLEDAAPSPKAPEKMEALGHTFEVLECAWDTTVGCKVGDQVTLLLTADGKVAGVASPGAGVRSTAVGMVTEGGAEVFLPNGGTLALTGSVSGADKLADQLVTITSGTRGVIGASRLAGKTASGPFNVEAMKLGSYTVAAGVRIYEQAEGGAMAPISLSNLSMGSIPANKIATYHLNSSNMVDYIVLNEVTGDTYEYGMLIIQSVSEPGADGVEVTNRRAFLVNHAGKKQLANAGYSGKSGSFTGVALGANNTFRGITELTAVANVKPADFFESQGVNYVTAGGRTYRVSDAVECYRRVDDDRTSEENWFKQSSGAQRLTACKAYSNDLTLYVDPISGQVRIVEAN
ncbi:S-layer homology domain-containing protein [Pseudoflavonifractor phocaeensis]|uniref:S-layer homology domain-containing protein n=1 Tax=Pseudoflavonifractor phocaeensis TaxID=1870988 RepID=UPI001F2C97C0|nr:S-layer homology domain-containing protein [Pseudoflavonifractor phocaeensis]MCF2661620.1 S-layer homology domain-containing protein [Pseudoflavonifractor phocaeensis]